MRTGVDSYSYHRLLGETRPGEDEPARENHMTTRDVILEATLLGADVLALETCFLTTDEAAGLAELAADTAAGIELAVSWGHPNGILYGRDQGAIAELEQWIDRAAAAGCRLVRLVAAGPLVERDDDRVDRTATVLQRLAERAAEHGVMLAIENHADFTAEELESVMSQVEPEAVGVCFDTANALRVGDDPLDAVRRLADRVVMVHLKDVASGPTTAATGPSSVPLGSGVVPVAGVLDTLHATGFAGPVCVELGHLGPGEHDERRLVAADFLRLSTLIDRYPKSTG